jgi:hypothetical protein
VKTEVNRLTRNVHAAGEAVQHRSPRGNALLSEERESIFVRVPDMNHERQIKIVSEPDLPGERPRLFGRRGEVPMEIEAGLPDTDDLGRLRQNPQGFQRFPVQCEGIVGMYAHRREDGLMLPGESHGPAALLKVGTDLDDQAYAVGTGPRDCLGPVPVKLLEGQVRVGVDKQGVVSASALGLC